MDSRVKLLYIINVGAVIEWLGLTWHDVEMALDGWTYGDAHYTLIHPDDFFQTLRWEGIIADEDNPEDEFAQTFESDSTVYINLEEV